MYETLVAQYDFPILKTDAQIQQEVEKAWQSVIPYYKLNKSVAMQAEKNLFSADLGKYSSAKVELAAALKMIYDKGVISQQSYAEHKDQNSDLIYIQKDKRAQKVPFSEVYTVESAEALFKYAVSHVCE